MEKVEHSLCNAHILRELVAIIEHEKENWAKRMKRLLLRSHRLWKNGGDCPPRVEKSEILKKIYDRIVENALKHYESLPELKPKGKEKRGKTKRRAGHNLALRLQKRQDDVLRFLFDARAPFTNNQAERDLRMTKVKQKISGCFRSEKGAKNFATLYGFFSTARKQGKNPLAEIQALFAAA
jgi:transposase